VTAPAAIEHLVPDRRRAWFATVAGAALISTSAVWVRWADVPPTASAFYRLAFGALFLGAFLLLVRAPLRWPRGALVGVLLAAIAFAADLMFWHRSILAVGPGLATLLANLQVFLLAAAGVLWLRERLAPGFYLGLLLAFAGLWLLIAPEWRYGSASFRLGVLFGLATSLCYAAYVLSLRAAQQAAPQAATESLLFWSSALCAVLLAAAAAFEGTTLAIPSWRSAGVLLAYALVAQVLGWVLITRGMRELPAAWVGLILLAQPALAFVWDVLGFGRRLSGLDLSALALVLLGIYGGTLGRSPGKDRESAT
jgi:drug/metabolite transporter (DMT)-like permease